MLPGVRWGVVGRPRYALFVRFFIEKPPPFPLPFCEVLCQKPPPFPPLFREV